MDATVIRRRLGPMPFDAPDGFWIAVWEAYQRPPRRYHTFDHVVDVVGEACRFRWARPREVALAALFHDAIYDVRAADNEARSAALAREAIGRWLPRRGIDEAQVERLIALTAAHGRVDRDQLSEEEALFLDCDTAILGSEPAVYDRYERAVAEEYAPVVTPEGWRAGRSAFLRGLLRRDRIFLTDVQRDRLERRARENLTRALQALEQPSPLTP